MKSTRFVSFVLIVSMMMSLFSYVAAAAEIDATSVSHNSITLEWDHFAALDGADFYKLIWPENSNGTDVYSAQPDGRWGITINNLIPLKTYTIRIIGIKNGSWEWVGERSITVTTLVSPEPAIYNMSQTETTISFGLMQISESSEKHITVTKDGASIPDLEADFTGLGYTAEGLSGYTLYNVAVTSPFKEFEPLSFQIKTWGVAIASAAATSLNVEFTNTKAAEWHMIVVTPKTPGANIPAKPSGAEPSNGEFATGYTFWNNQNTVTFTLNGLSPLSEYSITVMNGGWGWSEPRFSITGTTLSDMPTNPGLERPSEGFYPEIPVNTVPVPIAAKFNFDREFKDEVSGISGTMAPQHEYANGATGFGLRQGNNGTSTFGGENAVLLNNLVHDFSFSFWIYPETLSKDQTIFTKREFNWQQSAFHVSLFPQGQMRVHSDNDFGWYDFDTPESQVAADRWTHVAFVSDNAAGKAYWYINGMKVSTHNLPYYMYYNTMPLYFNSYAGILDDLCFYAKPLTEDEIRLAMDNKLVTYPLESLPKPGKQVKFTLSRIDMPIGNKDQSGGEGRVYQEAQRNAEGPDAIDWPEITLHIPQAKDSSQTVQLFEQGASTIVSLPLLANEAASPIAQKDYDSTVEPGNHWLRALEWLWGRTTVYTSDNTASTWAGSYELWTFPIKIQASSAGKINNVVLTYDGKELYNKIVSYDSLTLLLPANKSGKQYELSVNGGQPIDVSVGWQPIVGGNPQYLPIKVDKTTEDGITVKNVERPHIFPNQAEWNQDTNDLQKAAPKAPAFSYEHTGLESYLGIDVPRSPVNIYSIALAAGMSGGHYFSNSSAATDVELYKNIGTAAQYADNVANIGFDMVYEQTNSTNGQTMTDTSMDSLAIELAKKRVKLGLVPNSESNRPQLQNANMALMSYAIPEYHAPMYRDIQIELQRLSRYKNTAGVNIGADNSPYESYWSWAPPYPDRPYMEALINWQNKDTPQVAVPPNLQNYGYTLKDYEYYAEDAKTFVERILEYKQIFNQFGYFAGAVNELGSDLNFTSGSYGSAPGVGGRGGWGWGTVPVREMYQNVEIMQSYDWNEQRSSKPLQQISLLDRMRSYYPEKKAWALIDDFNLFMQKEDREAAYAMALTRGVQGVGTNTIPNDQGGKANPNKIADMKALYEWVHKYGGTYSMTQPDASVGIMYVDEQALMRGVISSSNDAPADELIKGSHEGKTAEAMVMLQAAGWPAKTITPEELLRGLPEGMHTIFLTGLNEFDSSWHWYDGLENALAAFVDGGGQIIKDRESVCPVSCTSTDMELCAYVINDDNDQTSRIISRNAENILRFNTAMASAKRPICVTGQTDAWVFPSAAGNTKYVTVVNAKHDGTNSALSGQMAELTWNNTDARPVYDVKAARLVSGNPAEADLTQTGFQYYALPVKPVVAPTVTVSSSEEKKGFYSAQVEIENDGVPLTGIPVEITVTGKDDSATVYSATGLTALLPLNDDCEAGEYIITATELLTGLMSTTAQRINEKEIEEKAVEVCRADAVKAFETRRQPLAIALTNAQYEDERYMAQAVRLKEYYENTGRNVTISKAEPFTTEGGIVKGLNPYMYPSKYPQWETEQTDIILLGNSNNNVLMLDQARGYLIERNEIPAIYYINSAFSGEYDTLNIIADGFPGIVKAVDYLLCEDSGDVEDDPQDRSNVFDLFNDGYPETLTALTKPSSMEIIAEERFNKKQILQVKQGSGWISGTWEIPGWSWKDIPIVANKKTSEDAYIVFYMYADDRFPTSTYQIEGNLPVNPAFDLPWGTKGWILRADKIQDLNSRIKLSIGTDGGGFCFGYIGVMVAEEPPTNDLPAFIAFKQSVTPGGGTDPTPPPTTDPTPPPTTDPTPPPATDPTPPPEGPIVTPAPGMFDLFNGGYLQDPDFSKPSSVAVITQPRFGNIPVMSVMDSANSWKSGRWELKGKWWRDIPIIANKAPDEKAYMVFYLYADDSFPTITYQIEGNSPVNPTFNLPWGTKGWVMRTDEIQNLNSAAKLDFGSDGWGFCFGYIGIIVAKEAPTSSLQAFEDFRQRVAPVWGVNEINTESGRARAWISKGSEELSADAKLLLASYDSQGKLIKAEVYEIPQGSYTPYFDYNNDIDKSLKAFLWDMGNLQPLGDFASTEP